MRIDIGGGTAPRDGHINLDPVHGDGGWQRMAQDVPWPADKETVERVYSSHCLEHIPAGEPRIAVFNEAWRVLVPKGTFRVHVPEFPHPLAVADPTHVSFWVPESFLYFTSSELAQADYGISLWELVQLERADKGFPEIQALLRKP